MICMTLLCKLQSTDVNEVTNVGKKGFTVLDFEGLDGRLELEEEFKLVLSGGFSLLEFSITIVTELVGLGEEGSVSLDFTSSLEGDGGFLVNGVLESFNVGNRCVVLISKSGNNGNKVVLSVVEVVGIGGFLGIEGDLSSLEVG